MYRHGRWWMIHKFWFIIKDPLSTFRCLKDDITGSIVLDFITFLPVKRQTNRRSYDKMTRCYYFVLGSWTLLGEAETMTSRQLLFRYISFFSDWILSLFYQSNVKPIVEVMTMTRCYFALGSWTLLGEETMTSRQLLFDIILFPTRLDSSSSMTLFSR